MITQYDTPAQDRYANTYVPLPYEQLMATVGARQGQLEKTQDMLARTYEDTQNLRYIPGTQDEAYVKDYLGKVSDLTNKYFTADLTNPVVKQQMRQEFNAITNRTGLQDIQTSYVNWMGNNKIKQQQIAEGIYDPVLDEDPASNPKFSTLGNGVYQYTTPVFKNPRPVAEQYFNNIKPTALPQEGNFYVQGVTPGKISEVADAKWNDFVNTSEGKLYVKKVAKENGLDYTDSEVRKTIATEYLKGVGKEYVYYDKNPLPEYMSSGANQPNKPVRNTTQTQTVRTDESYNPFGVEKMGPDLFDKDGNLKVTPTKSVGRPTGWAGPYGEVLPFGGEGLNKEAATMRESELKAQLQFVRQNIPQLAKLSDGDTYKAYMDITKDGRAFPDLPKLDLPNVPREELSKILGNSVTDRYIKVQDEFGQSDLRYFNDNTKGSPLKDLGYTPAQFRDELLNAGTASATGKPNNVTIDGLAQNGPEAGMIILGVTDKSKKGQGPKGAVSKIRKVYISTNDQFREIMRPSNEVYENMRNMRPGITIVGYSEAKDENGNPTSIPIAAKVTPNVYYDDKVKRWVYEPGLEGGYLTKDGFVSTGPEDISSINKMQLENLTSTDFTNAQWAASQINLTPKTKHTF